MGAERAGGQCFRVKAESVGDMAAPRPDELGARRAGQRRLQAASAWRMAPTASGIIASDTSR